MKTSNHFAKMCIKPFQDFKNPIEMFVDRYS